MATNGRNGMQRALARMVETEPELAARLLVTALPAAAASVPGQFDYRLVLAGAGAYHVAVTGDGARVTEDDAGTANGRSTSRSRPSPSRSRASRRAQARCG